MFCSCPLNSGSELQPNKRSPSPNMGQYSNSKRNLRPRVELKNYVETTDMVVLSDIDEYKINGYANGYDCSDSDDDVELPPIPLPKVCFDRFYFQSYSGIMS